MKLNELMKVYDEKMTITMHNKKCDGYIKVIENMSYSEITSLNENDLTFKAYGVIRNFDIDFMVVENNILKIKLFNTRDTWVNRIDELRSKKY